MRMIDADILKEVLKSNCKPELCHDYNTAWCEHCCPLNDFEDLIDNATTIEQEVYITGDDYDLYIRGYKQGREDFERPQGEWIEFADFVARNVVSEDFSEDVDFYAEVLCRKLVKLGLVKLEGDVYKYCGADAGGKEE